MEFVRLPDDAPSVLARDTIELDDLRLAWPQILSATRDNPERYLCPYMRSVNFYNGEQARRSVECDSATANQASLPEHPPSPKPNIGVPRSDRLVNSHGRPTSLSSPNGEEVNSCTTGAKPRDPKSFAQALFDTNALNRFYATSDRRARPCASQHPSYQSPTYGRSRSETGAGMAPTDQYRGIPAKSGSEQLQQQEANPQFLAKRVTHPGPPPPAIANGSSIDTFQYRDGATEERPRPQTLSHFSMKNVKALWRSAHVSHDPLLKEQYTNDFFGWTVAQGTVGRISPIVGSVRTSITPFARQSMVYVLSNLSALASSFKWNSHIPHPGGPFENSFNDIVQAFFWLRKLEGYPPIILPGLSLAASAFYDSFLSMKDAERLHRTKIPPTLRALTDEEDLEIFHLAMATTEAAHITNIFFAALVAAIPPCNELVWSLVVDCHRKGVMVQDQVKDPVVIRSLQLVLDSFEDSTALDLLAKLVKVHAMGDEATSEDDTYHPPTENSYHVLGWVIDHLLVTESRPFAYSTNAAELCWQYDHLPPGKRRMGSPRYSAMIVEWLKVLVMKHWDGKPVVDLSSVAGNALEVLWHFSKHVGGGYRQFGMPMLVAQLDFLNMPTDWPDPVAGTDHKHLLQYPFILDLKGRVCCFRAMNYAKMFKAHEDSAAASRLLAQMSFPDTLTGRGEIRLRDKLGSVLRSHFVIEIRRQSILVDALDQLWRREKCELMKPLKVRMGMDEGEEGVDHGGVQQEFFRIAIAEVLDPDYGLFTVIDEQTQMTWLRPCSREPLYKYELVGLLFSLAMYNGLTLPVNFPLVFYHKLQGFKATRLEAIEDGWPALAKGLESLLDWSDGDVADVFARTYEFVFETLGQVFTIDMRHIRLEKEDELREAYCSCCGRLRSRSHIIHAGDQDLNLPPRSPESSAEEDETTAEPATPINSSSPSPLMVTNKNREQYVKDYIFWLTDKSIRPEYDAFARGFFTCISPQSLTLLRTHDFKRLVEGTQEVTVEDLRKIAQYDGGYTPTHETIQDFWTTVADFSPEQIRLLLEFVTASDRLPVTGVDNLTFAIQKNGEGDDRLPTSLTCYGRLLLPAYSSRAVLREKLCLAIENCKGFGVP
ncbi:MAG: hypothetical protein Q9172_004455 [Xanthocarpia lactea]